MFPECKYKSLLLGRVPSVHENELCAYIECFQNVSELKYCTR